MSRAYTDFNCSKWWGKFREHYPKNRNKENFVEWVELTAQRIEDHYSGDKDVKTFCWEFVMHCSCIYAKKFNNSVHYFLEDGVAEFLFSSVKNYSSDYFRYESLISITNNETKGMFTKATSAIDGFSKQGFFIHFPSSERKSSLFVVPLYMNEDNLNNLVFIATFGDSGFENYWIMQEKDKDYCKDREPDINNDLDYGRSIIFGLSLYIDAFPDVVREADNIKHVGHYKGHRHSVRANDIVRTEATHSVSPHFRRGHFRLLQSEKFKAKRGQAIFIKGCFVKGHAFDVLADDGKSVGGVA